MKEVILRKMRTLCLIAAASFAILASSCQMCQLTKNCGDDGECHGHAKVCHDPTMHAMASDLDYLEAHIDKYGSVVAMQPSVWGQARLTKYRDDFEKEMVKDLTNFNETLQGSVTRSDQAYLANALAIAAAASAPPKTPSFLFKYPNPTMQVSLNQASAPSAAPTPPPVQTGVFDGFNSISRNPTATPLNIGFAGMANGGISLEPTVILAQKKRYLNALNQIRRNNEGDDTADSPGYSLNLVRIPVSVLPGKCTLKGYGAEITLTLTPEISDELLSQTFQQLVLNDLEDQLSLPFTNTIEQFSENEINRYLDDEWKISRELEVLRRKIALSSITGEAVTTWEGLGNNEVAEEYRNKDAEAVAQKWKANLKDFIRSAPRAMACRTGSTRVAEHCG